MKFRKMLCLVSTLAVMITGCNKQAPVTPSSESTPESTSSEEIDYGELIIEDIDIWYGNKYDTLDITFTKPEYKSKITYNVKNQLISFEGDTVKQEKDGKRTIEVEATTEYHKTTFNVNLHNQPAHSSDIGFFALDRTQRGFGKGQVLFVGDSFFDPRYSNTWENFYNDVEGDGYQVFCSGSAGSKIEEWRGLAMKMIYTPAPKYILLNAGSNDFWDGGNSVENVVEHFRLLIKDIHKHLPEAEIFYYTMINRDGAMATKTAEYTANVVKSYNEAIKEVIKDDPLVKLCDIYDHFVNTDGSAKSDLLKDGCHPKNEQYKYIVETAIAAGAPIKYIGEY